MLYALTVLGVTVFYRFGDQIVYAKLGNFTVFKLHLDKAGFFLSVCVG